MCGCTPSYAGRWERTLVAHHVTRAGPYGLWSCWHRRDSWPAHLIGAWPGQPDRSARALGEPVRSMLTRSALVWRDAYTPGRAVWWAAIRCAGRSVGGRRVTAGKPIWSAHVPSKLIRWVALPRRSRSGERAPRARTDLGGAREGVGGRGRKGGWGVSPWSTSAAALLGWVGYAVGSGGCRLGVLGGLWGF